MMLGRYQTLFSLILIFFIECGLVPDILPMGFNCGDPNISHKFHGDTVSANMLLSITFFIPLIVLITIEWKYGKRNGIKGAWLKQAFNHYRYYLSGFLIVFTVVTVCKVIVGEPRPHFLDTCRPKEAVNCTSGYFTTYKCLNTNVSSYMMRDAKKSFPSGHAGFSFYLFTYLALFLHNRLRRVSPIMLTWIHTLIFLWAIFCAWTRITDRRHHWWDVIAGATLGIVIAFFSKRNFIEDTSTVDDNEKHNAQEISSNLSQILKTTHPYNHIHHQIPRSNEYVAEDNHNRPLE